jgi:hypothetical protein
VSYLPHILAGSDILTEGRIVSVIRSKREARPDPVSGMPVTDGKLSTQSIPPSKASQAKYSAKYLANKELPAPPVSYENHIATPPKCLAASASTLVLQCFCRMMLRRAFTHADEIPTNVRFTRS